MKYILRSSRPQFLILAPICVLAGLAASLSTGAPINGFHLFLAFIGAILAHASVNLLNEYDDFTSGLDFNTLKTPFSGGTGNLIENPQQASQVRLAGWVTAGITLIIGVIIAIQSGWGIVPLGLLGLIMIILYTPVLNHYPWLCIISPGLGFGTFMVMGTEYAISGHYSWTGFLISLVPFFLVNNLLLLNQFPDVEPDRAIGRNHFLIVYGKKAGAILYTLFLACAYIVLVTGVLLKLFPIGALLGLLTLFIAIPTVRNIFNTMNDMEKFVPSLGMNVIITLVTPLLAALGMMLIH
jgi:1,4-dihydroxy-2-naphthoate octaprenyltransferase